MVDPQGVNDHIALRFKALEREIELRFQALEREMNLELRSSEIAMSRANDQWDHRLAGLNEFREAMKDQAAHYATRTELDALRESHENLIRNLSRQVYIIVGSLAVIMTVVQVLISQIK